MAEFKRIIQRITNSGRIESGAAQLEQNELCIVEDTEELIYKNKNGKYISVSKDKYTVDNIEKLKESNNYKIGDVIKVSGFYIPSDGKHHLRKISKQNDLSGILLNNGLYANIVSKDEVNLSWFGILENNSPQDINYIIDYCYNTQCILNNDVRNVIPKTDITNKLSGIKIKGFNFMDSLSNANKFLKSSSNKNYFGKINSGNLNVILGSNELRVVTVSDSILSAKTLDSTSGLITEVNQNTSEASIFDLIRLNLENKCKNLNCDLKIYNRGIGGRRIQDIFEPNAGGLPVGFNEWLTTDGKVWLDYVKDLNPDIIILAFGMNEGDHFNNFYNSLARFKTEITGWFKIPKVIIVPTPRPSIGWNIDSNIANTGWQQMIRQSSADISRWFGVVNDFYVMDINRKFNLEVSGFDVANSYIDNKEIYLNIQNNGKVVSTAQQSKNFIWKQKIRLSTPEEYVLLTFRPNRYGGTGHVYTVQIHYTYFFLKNKDRVIFNPAHNIDFTTERDLEIVIHDNVLRIIVDGRTFIESRELYELAWEHDLIINNNYSDIKQDSFKCYLFKYTMYGQNYTYDEIYGKFIQDDYETKVDTGGNGVNHLSSLGIKVIYDPCIIEMVSDLNLKINNFILENFTIQNGTELIDVSKLKYGLNKIKYFWQQQSTPTNKYIYIDLEILKITGFLCITNFSVNKNLDMDIVFSIEDNIPSIIASTSGVYLCKKINMLENL
ncbi:MAG: hypothetical protein RSA91_07625 [Bacilli bacterium]